LAFGQSLRGVARSGAGERGSHQLGAHCSTGQSKPARLVRLRVVARTETEKTMDEEPRRKNDLVAKLYVAFGVPAIILFMVVLFSFTRSCGIPA
jgi:hypothetical protein